MLEFGVLLILLPKGCRFFRMELLKKLTTGVLVILVLCQTAAALTLEDALDRFDLPAAKRIVDEIDPSGKSKQYSLARAAILFLEGDYEAAERQLDGLKVPGAAATKQLAMANRIATAEMATAWSPSRRFVVRYVPGPDEAMLPYVFEAAEAAFNALTAALKIDAATPIRIEIAASVDQLGLISGTDRNALARSGAVAVSDYNKIMLLSPSQLPFGYPYADTVAHELVHHLLTTHAGSRLPVWFQEATAKYLEPIWRGGDAGFLPRTQRDLLEDAFVSGNLMRLDELRSSFSLMPSSEKTALAFAQLSSFADFLVRTEGDDVLVRLANEMRVGDEAVSVLRATGKSLDELESAWLASFGATFDDSVAEDGRSRVILLRESNPIEQGLSAQAQADLRLGDLFRESGRYAAAARLYKQVVSSDAHPLLVARLTAALNEAGEHLEVLDTLDKYALDEFEWPILARERGRALVSLERHSEAEMPLMTAVRFDPYDPGTHKALARVMTALERPFEAEREQRLSVMWR